MSRIPPEYSAARDLPILRLEWCHSKTIRLLLAFVLFGACPGRIRPAIERIASHRSSTYSSGRHASRASKRSSRRSSTYDSYGSRRASGVPRDSHGRIKRSRTERASFVRSHPCPATGKTSGACRGYVVDHRKPLECGGADAPGNMQWQTTAEGKAKDKTEGRCR